jgi:hypothetical protein
MSDCSCEEREGERAYIEALETRIGNLETTIKVLRGMESPDVKSVEQEYGNGHSRDWENGYDEGFYAHRDVAREEMLLAIEKSMPLPGAGRGEPRTDDELLAEAKEIIRLAN